MLTKVRGSPFKVRQPLQRFCGEVFQPDLHPHTGNKPPIFDHPIAQPVAVNVHHELHYLSADNNQEGGWARTLVIEVQLDMTDIGHVKVGNISEEGKQVRAVMRKLKEAIISSESAQDDCTLNVEDADAAVSQAVVSEVKTCVSFSMLAANDGGRNDPERTRRKQQMKELILCNACEKRGHWWTDHAYFKDRVYKNRRTIDGNGGFLGMDDAVASYDPPPHVRDI